ncbi:PEP/pyruvate-binding domain-containing protein [Sphaerisporangium perillae]|uniref:PEP/pyruvate-binding domain-containing protein n=1 Tax=Sphaerisporangium perillae TaxID=2935860 RepID=UPI00200E631E|nr:PEP/pyruvate-binding domain-containing protein [Sphaerisporangium perillae]
MTVSLEETFVSAPVTRWFADLLITDRPTVGGKCAGLGELVHAGVEVPDGFAVTVSAFETFRAVDGLGDKLTALVLGAEPGSVSSLARAQDEATTLVRRTAMPAAMAAEIRAGYHELCARFGVEDLPVAVRSSAVAEDGDAASFAGQQETFLWVVGADSVLEHVKECWASLYTPQAIAYRTSLPEDQASEALRISVAVQAMVDAEVAGVAFTVSPRTGDRSVVAINASWGLGHAVVSGEVTPDEFWVSKVGLEVTRTTVAHKAHRCVPDPSGRGTTTEDVPVDRRDVPCLDDASVLQLAEMAIRVERHYGCPQDIEWAMTHVDGEPRFVLLQSRPETTWKQRQAEARAMTPQAGYLSLIHAAAKRHGGR